MKNHFIRYLFLVAIFCFSICHLSFADEFQSLENGTEYNIDTLQEVGFSPRIGDIIKMRLKKFSSDGTMIFNTDDLGHPDGVEMTIGDNFMKGDIMEVFLKMKPGETATAYIPVWVADQNETEKNNDKRYKYIISLISFKTQEALHLEQELLLQKLKKEQKSLFDQISHRLYPEYKCTYQKDGLYILKKDTKTVKKRQKIKSKQSVSVHYILKLLPDYTELDNSYKRNSPYTFQVDNDEAIKGWDLALMQLKKGDHAILLIPSWLAYGFTGSGGDIPPNTPLYFEIEVEK
ncbi:MAG: FKBP-type peptidyl-prolyl cis-trans isomerase [Chitinophagales bacterium]|nr:FKBP-type peptidyl-prolyl cis-trans isomerase [Chitinophagales bacterium]